jgi:predicted nuclease with RNAse H fold
MCVAGIDLGSYSSPSYVAWLGDNRLVVDMYRPRPDHWLPVPPKDWPLPTVMAIDGPQGLAAPGADPAIRKADAETHTPTRRLPRSRKELTSWKLYKPLIILAIDLFWHCYQNPSYSIYGLGNNGCLVCETWPRLILKRLGGQQTIPSKRQDPFAYSDTVVRLLDRLGVAVPGLLHPTSDQCDAILCALLAERLGMKANVDLVETFGSPPLIDETDGVLHEGWIVAPKQQKEIL